MGQWISHEAIQDNAILPQDCYSYAIKFDGFLKPGQYIEVLADHNWYIPLISGQQVEVNEEIRVNGTMIVAQV
jgi:hypothetical protein